MPPGLYWPVRVEKRVSNVPLQFASFRYDLIKKWKEKKKDQKRMSNEERRQSRRDEEAREEILKENARELYAIFSVVCHNVTSRY